MQYEVRYVAISTYYHSYLGVKMTKEEARRMGITLERPEFLVVSIKDFSLCFHILCFHYAFITLWFFMLYASITPIWTHLHAIMLLLCRCVQIGVMEKTSPGRHWWIIGVMRLEPGRL